MTVNTLGPEADLIYQALAQPIGLLINCDDFEAFRTRLYKVKSTLADPALQALQFRRSNIEGGNMLIVKLRIDLDARPPMLPSPLEETAQ